MITDESVKCLGVLDGQRLYYDGKHNDYFVLTKKFRITRYPKRVDFNLGEWCEKMIKSHKKQLSEQIKMHKL